VADTPDKSGREFCSPRIRCSWAERSISRGDGRAYRSGNAEERVERRRRWNYSLLKSINSTLYPGGHSVSVGADLNHRMWERAEIAVGYSHVHESYRQVPSAFFSPDSNRVYASVKYGFSRPIGR